MPDSDNEDEIDIREPSVQILESHVQPTTYSVPSDSDYGSDPDDFQLEDDFEASSNPPDHSQGSAITTPDQHVPRIFQDAERGDLKGKTLDLNLEGPSLQEVIAKTACEGSSQNNPIDIADQGVLDEEPQEQMKSNAFVKMDSNETESEDEGPEILPIQPTIKRSDITSLLNQKPITLQKTSSQIPSAMAETDDDNDDEVDEEEEEAEACEVDDMGRGISPKFDQISDFDGSPLYNPSIERPNHPRGISNRCESSPERAFCTQRAPSPSDAALARTPYVVEALPKRTATRSSGFFQQADMFPEPLNMSLDAYDDMMARQYISSPAPVPHGAAMMRSTATSASKLQIANLINSSPAESSRSNKRKADVLSLDTDKDLFGTAIPRHLSMTQDIPLPDARPRDAPMTTDSSGAPYETSTPSPYSRMAEVATASSQAEQPTQKRAKTSSPSSSSGIGKFLIGVGVGAVGLAATFLATIPAQVQEEARLGL